LLLVLIVIVIAAASVAQGGETKRLLLIGQGPDNHPKGTHEYAAGMQVLGKCLSGVPDLEITQSRADGDWPEGRELLAKADGAVLFVSEGAKWLNSDPARRTAFAALAKRRGGLAVTHWGMGTKDATNIEPFVALFGACHGGPDRKFKVIESLVRIAAPDHPVSSGLTDFTVKEEFYYALKREPAAKDFTPLLTVEIDGNQEMVAWAWKRPDGGRSFGYSGLHFHELWRRAEYQRFLSQGVLWTLDITPPAAGFPVELTSADLHLP
jgi:hypothetical protein